MRMKTAVTAHVQNASGTMFRDATDAVQRELDQMCRQIRDVIDEQVELVYTRVSRDYLAVLVGIDAYQPDAGPNSECFLL